ncbi:efflux RND transporter periplasmic adaptor subunit [Pedobacter sp. L105]|uniref:efflux RND transporter periplasmic adaptor subunit n=1 Tax=Pedobacter sp. L105 TaxID=1641871 RepID=UPI00131AE266|nr:HlyD family efflux transporter periplasmic adaptor subunit [Pedobacter sp. L105]
MNYYPLVFFCALFFLFGCKHKNEITPQRKEIVDAVFGSGHIENINQYAVMANAEGYIKTVNISEGDTVKKGQVLYRLTNDVQRTQVENAIVNLRFAKTNTSAVSPQIEQLKIQIVQAQDKAQVDSTNYARYKRLVETNAVSRTDYENAELQYRSSVSSLKVLKKNLADLKHNLNQNVDNAKAQYLIQQQSNDYYDITAKADGVVMSITKKVGDYVKKGDQIAEVGAGHIIVKLYVAEEDIQRVKLGQTALISLNSNNDKVYPSTVTKIYPSFDTNQQAFTVEATFRELPPQHLNGTQLQANIIIEEKKNALVIPSFYLMDGDYVLSGKNKIKVKVGILTLEWTEILSGLTENEALTQPKS